MAEKRSVPAQRDGVMAALPTSELTGVTTREVSAPSSRWIPVSACRLLLHTHVNSPWQLGWPKKSYFTYSIKSNQSTAQGKFWCFFFFLLKQAQRKLCCWILNAPTLHCGAGRKPVFGKSSAWERNVPSSQIRSWWDRAIKSVLLLGLIWCCYLTAPHQPSRNLYTL